MKGKWKPRATLEGLRQANERKTQGKWKARVTQEGLRQGNEREMKWLWLKGNDCGWTRIQFGLRGRRVLRRKLNGNGKLIGTAMAMSVGVAYLLSEISENLFSTAWFVSLQETCRSGSSQTKSGNFFLNFLWSESCLTYMFLKGKQIILWTTEVIDF